MWCERCFYGSPATRSGKCPQCGGSISESKNPFPSDPIGMGSGKPKHERGTRADAKEDRDA